MRAVVALLTAVLCLPALAADKRGGETLIYKVDSVIATIRQGVLHIQARGAVSSGGWKRPALKLMRAPADPHALVVEFVAAPPPANEAVIQALLPVSANLVVPLHRGVVTVRVVSSANDMTTQILK